MIDFASQAHLCSLFVNPLLSFGTRLNPHLCGHQRSQFKVPLLPFRTDLKAAFKSLFGEGVRCVFFTVDPGPAQYQAAGMLSQFDVNPSVP